MKARRVAWALVVAALVFGVGWGAKISWCRFFCDGGVCPPCPDDPPIGTLAPVVVRQATETTPLEVTP